MTEFTDLRGKFLDEEYAHAYIEDFQNAFIATQIKVLREDRSWTQEELGDRADMKQARISLLEDVNYSSWSVKTLRRLAKAFDLRLKVSFETFSSGIDEINGFSRETLKRDSRNADLTKLVDLPGAAHSAFQEHFQRLTSQVEPLSKFAALPGVGGQLSALRLLKGLTDEASSYQYGTLRMALSDKRPESNRLSARATGT